MKAHHAQGRSVEDVAHILKRAPLDRHITAAIKSVHALGYELSPPAVLIGRRVRRKSPVTSSLIECVSLSLADVI